MLFLHAAATVAVTAFLSVGGKRRQSPLFFFANSNRPRCVVPLRVGGDSGDDKDPVLEAIKNLSTQMNGMKTEILNETKTLMNEMKTEILNETKTLMNERNKILDGMDDKLDFLLRS